jgi:hypothetical protein
LVLAGVLLTEPPHARGTVGLELRGAWPNVVVGDTVEVQLFAVSESGLRENVAAIQAILVWDASAFRLSGLSDPCVGTPCPPNTYHWLDSSFPMDVMGEGLNADCSPTEFCDPYTGIPYNDGTAVYRAWAWFEPNPPAVATAEGLHVTTFVFEAIRVGEAQIALTETLGGVARTMVAGSASGSDITGTIGPGVDIVVHCSPPEASAIGPRYLAVTPAPGEDAVALVVSGSRDDPDVGCVSLYVQSDGSVGEEPVFMTPSEWGQVYVTGRDVVPSTTYSVRTVCGAQDDSGVTSAPVGATTWRWGDVTNDGYVFFDDITRVIDGSMGVFPDGVIAQTLDLAPCTPDGVIDELDVGAVQDAYRDIPFPCEMPCSDEVGLDDFADFVECMDGPGDLVPFVCEYFDYDADIDVDLADMCGFQEDFTGADAAGGR